MIAFQSSKSKSHAWPDRSFRFSVGTFPKANCFQPEPGTEIVSIERGKLPESVNAPLVQDLQNLPDLSLSIFRRSRALHALKFILKEWIRSSEHFLPMDKPHRPVDQIVSRARAGSRFSLVSQVASGKKKESRG